ncbi:MAG TPA: cyclase [Planctomycetaceae bacterium]|nr:cyclase [Planctomycetaceae bacterium]
MTQLAAAQNDRMPTIASEQKLRKTTGLCDQHAQPNVSSGERWVSMLAGGGMVVCGLMQRSRWGAVSLLTGASLLYRGLTGHCAAYESLGIDTAAADRSHSGVRGGHGRKITWAIQINRDPHDLYDHWHKLENLPKMMRHLKSVKSTGERKTHWEAYAPMGQMLTWDAEIVTDRAGEVIAWRSLPGSQVDTAGSVHFKRSSHGVGTDLTVSLKYDPPGGQLVARLAHLLGQGLEEEVEEDLRIFKQMIETGEVATAARHA